MCIFIGNFLQSWARVLVPSAATKAVKPELQVDATRCEWAHCSGSTVTLRNIRIEGHLR